MVSGRVVAAWGAGSLVVVGAVAAVLINELHGGVGGGLLPLWWWGCGRLVRGGWRIGWAGLVVFVRVWGRCWLIASRGR